MSFFSVFSKLTSGLFTSIVINNPAGEPAIYMNVQNAGGNTYSFWELDSGSAHLASFREGIKTGEIKESQIKQESGRPLTSSMLMGVSSLDLLGKAMGYSGTFSTGFGATGLVLGFLNNPDQFNKAIANAAYYPHFAYVSAKPISEKIDINKFGEIAYETYRKIKPLIDSKKCVSNSDNSKVMVNEKETRMPYYQAYADGDKNTPSLLERGWSCPDGDFLYIRVETNLIEKSHWKKTFKEENALIITLQSSTRKEEQEAAQEKIFRDMAKGDENAFFHWKPIKVENVFMQHGEYIASTPIKIVK